MIGKIGGQHPRPRVALLGFFEEEDVRCFERLFPTIWQAPNIAEMKQKVDEREIDLLIIAPLQDEVLYWPQYMHVICFSKEVPDLPGPVKASLVKADDIARTEGFILPDVPLPVDRCRAVNSRNLMSVRGWPCLSLSADYRLDSGLRQLAENIFVAGAIICELETKAVLGAAFLREDSKLGVAWLPSAKTNIAAWVEVFVTQWAQIDTERFPGFGDWQKSPEWMVPAEERILSKIESLEKKGKKFVAAIDKQIEKLTEEYNAAKIDANARRRRLITAQGDELVDEVFATLQALKFQVLNMDAQLVNNQPKREDLRIVHSQKGGEKWTALVEIRGYARSGGTTSDLIRLGRFAELFRKETGRLPDKRIYIVNGQLELLPSQRPQPLAGAVEDLDVFSESDGILIWSLDLFRAMKAAVPEDYPILLESIKNAQGRWLPPILQSSKDTS